MPPREAVVRGVVGSLSAEAVPPLARGPPFPREDLCLASPVIKVTSRHCSAACNEIVTLHIVLHFRCLHFSFFCLRKKEIREAHKNQGCTHAHTYVSMRGAVLPRHPLSSSKCTLGGKAKDITHTAEDGRDRGQGQGAVSILKARVALRRMGSKWLKVVCYEQVRSLGFSRRNKCLYHPKTHIMLK